MKLNADDLLLLSNCAIAAAFQAGRIISKHAGQPVAVKTKKCGSSKAAQVVTEIDLLCQDVILQTLLPTCAIYDLALLSEETPDNKARLDKNYFWCIDPLDGTLPFVQSTPGYAVSVALVSRQGVPHIGVIYDPVEQALYHAVKGCGAFQNGKPLKLDFAASPPEQTMTFIADRSFAEHPLYSTVLSELKHMAVEMGYAGLNTVMQGGAVMNACWVLEKKPACYFKFPKLLEGGGSLWDYAATACVFQEAGPVVSDIFADPLDLNRQDSTFMNHRGVLYSSSQDLAERVVNLYAELQKDKLPPLGG